MGVEMCVDSNRYCGHMIDRIPAWAAWIAQDSSGAWWAYESEPNMSDTGWYENEVGALKKLSQSEPNLAWKMTLRKI